MADFSAWEAYKPITVQDTNVDAALTDFPQPVEMSGDTDVGARCQADGDDIRFTLSDGTTELDFELLSFSVSGGAADGKWRVKVPSIAASGGASLRMYYGNDAAASGEDVPNTWNSNLSMVWHMENATTSTVADATSNGYTGTKYAASQPVEATGHWHKSQDFDGTNDYIDSNQTLDTLLSASTGMVTCWVKAKGTAPTVSNAYDGDAIWGQIYNSRWCGITQGIISGNDRLWIWNWDGSEDRVGVTYTGSTWHHIVWLHDAGTLYAYKDGALVSSTASGNTGSVLQDNFIGACGGGSPARFFEGEIEDVWFFDVIPTNVAAWIKYQYYSDNEADHEITWGSEVVQGADTKPWWYYQHAMLGA